MNYDHEGRLRTITKKINDDDANKRVIATNTYDALGQLKNKKTGQKSATDVTVLEDDDYNYNIRGWLKDINYYSSSGAYGSQMSSSPTINKWFSMDLSYDWGFGTASQYNGNICGTRWKTAGDGQERAYGFKYDAANRLLKGDFTQNNSGWNNSAGIDFSMQVGDEATGILPYDENGNIKFMQQYGLQVTKSAPIDKMTYLYKQTNQVSNQLLAVTEDPSISNTDHKLGDFTDKNTTADDYDYDANGNLLYDKNKKITLIEYNHLNLPWRLTVQNDDGTNKGSIVYVYDAAGNKLEKRAIEGTSSQPTKQTATTYLGSFIYENNVLQFFSHEEGRVRYKAINTYVYDYFIKDHLGNVRIVLTDQQQIDHYPTATLEGSGTGSPVENEKVYYDINNSYVQDQPSPLTPNYFNDNGTNNTNTFGDRNATSQKMYVLNAATNRTGLGMVLKVMAGDKINVLGKSYYNYYNGTVSNTTFDASALISAFLSVAGPKNVAAVHGATNTLLNANNTGTVVPIKAFSDNNPVNATNNIKAGIAYILFDDQFKYAGGGFDPVAASSSSPLKSHVLPDINVPKNGYIYIYCSNESNINVFFDNLEVIDKRGPLTEENHYYPFGLTMAGISSKSAGGIENKHKYNAGSELNTDFDINLYETQFRSLDPQIGRFWQLDPKPNEFESLYTSMKNNPILFNDPLGDTIRLNGSNDAIDAFLGILNSTTGNTYENNDGILTRTNKKLNTKSNKNISGSLSKKLESMINGEVTNDLNVKNDDKSDGGIIFDKFNTREVDMKDFGALKNNVQKASLLGHFLEEYSYDPQEACNTGRLEDRSTFDTYHQKGIDFENKIASEMTGGKTSFRGNVQSMLPANKDGIQDVKQNFNFGSFQFNVIFKGYTTPGYWKGNSIYVGPVHGSTGVIKSVE